MTTDVSSQDLWKVRWSLISSYQPNCSHYSCKNKWPNFENPKRQKYHLSPPNCQNPPPLSKRNQIKIYRQLDHNQWHPRPAMIPIGIESSSSSFWKGACFKIMTSSRDLRAPGTQTLSVFFCFCFSVVGGKRHTRGSEKKLLIYWCW